MIDLRTLEQILSDQAEELTVKERHNYCLRHEESLIDLDSPQAQVVIGIRRCGKSTLCYNALRHAGVNFAYVNFDDERLAMLNSDDLNNVLETLYKINGSFDYLFLDEIQNVNGWHLFVNRLLRREMKIIVTGSNAKLLSGELATHLTGRHNTITLFPFSFAEYCLCTGVDTTGQSTEKKALRRKAFDQYTALGGFPELLKIKNHKSYIDNLTENILKRDIEQRFKPAHVSSFVTIARSLLNEAPTKLSYSAIGSNFGIKSPHTVKNYISYLQQAYLLLSLHKFSPKSRLRLVGEKIYTSDVALMDKRTDAFSGPNLGWRLETIIYIELLRRCKRAGLDIYYLDDSRNECDFIVCENNKTIQAIQVSYDLSSARTRERETKGLLMAAKKTGCDNLLLLTDHEYSDEHINGLNIQIRPAYDWLLGVHRS